MQVHSIALSLVFIATLNLCAAQAATKASKKNNVERPPAITLTGSGEIDQRIAAAETALTQLSASLEKLRQDSAKAALDGASSKASAQTKITPLENLYAQKMQDLASLKAQRDKARQDSIALSLKKIAKSAGQRQEAARMDATIMAASNQLNTLSTRRQQMPAEGASLEGKTIAGLERDIVRTDSIVSAKQAEIAALGKKCDGLRQDSLSEESKALDARGRIQAEAKRLDSLLQLSSVLQADAASKQAKNSELSAGVAAQQAKLDEYSRTKAVLDAQIARAGNEIAALTAERDRLRTAAGSSQKKIDQQRLPLVAALAGAETQLQEKNDQRDGLASMSEKVRLDSILQKAKDALNTAIEQQAVGKKGAEKAVAQREADITDIMGKLDDVVRKNPKLAQVSGSVSGLSTTAEKRRRLDTLNATLAADIAAQTLQRDRAKRFLEDFDRQHPAPASSRSSLLIDSMLVARERTAAALAGRRDSIESQIVIFERSVESLRAKAHEETAKGDSAAAVVRKQRADLSAQRMQVRADSIKNESSFMVALIRVRTEQSNISARTSVLQRDIANLGAAKERYKQSIIDAQNRERLAKAANAAEIKRLDSLIGAKERDVTQLSLQNEKMNQESQVALKEIDAMIQKQASLIVSLVSQINTAQQDAAVLAQQLDAARKDRALVEKTGQEKSVSIEREKAATIASIAAKKNETALLRSQREELRRALVSEVAHIDSLIAAAGKVIATYEGMREKSRKDSIAAEALKVDAQIKSIAALRSCDSLIGVKQQQISDAALVVEKARQDSAVKSAPQSELVDKALRAADSLVALKERELADARQQREKARMNQIAQQRQQFAAVVAAHQDVVTKRTLLDQKKAEATLAQSQRKKIQQDSAAAAARYLTASRSAGGDVARNIGLIQQKNYELSALQTQRSDYAGKLAAMGAAAPTPAPLAPSTSGASPASTGGSPSDIGQKQVEEIYQLLSSEKYEEAIARFNAQKSYLAKTAGAEAFAVLKTTIEQIQQTLKKSK